MARDFEPTSFLYGGNAAFIADLYQRYLADPQSVDASWRHFFAELGDEADAVSAEARGASWAAPAPPPALVDVLASSETTGNGAAAILDMAADARGPRVDSIRALMLIRAYRVRGHLIADLDPLGLESRDYHPELDPATYGFTANDLDRPIFIDNVLGLEWATMNEIVEVLRKTYCGTAGYEFMHNQHPDQKSWIQMRVEGHDFRPRFTPEGRRKILKRLIAAEGLEHFLNTRYLGTKRFGVEGAESLIPLLEAVIQRASELGVEEIIIGMPHRGRINVLANIMAKPRVEIFSEFHGGTAHPEDVQGSGDVKYHLGTSTDRELDGKQIHLSLTANPSHLEAVDPVVVGKVRAKQTQRGDDEHKRVMAILMHGDAAFAGQGLVSETLGLSELRGYRTGGTVHIIVNNQIGFTTSPSQSRSSPYPSDVAKTVQAPIFHVNGDDPEAVVHIGRAATEFRHSFGKDVVIDMFCYRRFGHNEIDEPGFTQPMMYRRIAELPTTRELYARKLIEDGVLTQGDVEAMEQTHRDELEAEYEAAKAFKPNKADWLEGEWARMKVAGGGDRRGVTEVDLETLTEVVRALSTAPAELNLHRTIRRQLEAKRKMIDSGVGIDWATGEALAFGSLLVEDCKVRLSGQDSARGTFSQRHSVLVDQEGEHTYTPLNHLREGQARYEVVDSMLSEAAVLGFEYGYSLAAPNTLVLWEAQFGDFANGAQVIIDQFIASGESKWLRMCGLVMLLPHGQEGQGPEHSSARVERFLQLCAEDNMQVVNITTPANYFHALRRQLHREFRKPLIVMTPKGLLRHKRAVSRLAEMGPGTSFHRVLWDDGKVGPDAKIKRVVLCSGKLYYELEEARDARGLEDIYLMRIEQLYPFPNDPLAVELGRFTGAEVVWCQEEPENQGPWTVVAPCIENVMERLGGAGTRLRYIGRAAAAAPAPGTASVHANEQARLIDEALTR